MKDDPKDARGLASIADAKALLEGLFHASPVAFQVYRSDGHCLIVNEAFRQLFGAEPPPEYNVLRDELLEKQGFLDLVRKAFAGETMHVPSHWYDPRELRQVEVREGRRVGIEVTLFPLRNAGGAVEHIALCFKDVTEQMERQQERDQFHQAAAALRESEAHQTAILASALDAIVGMDHQGRITEFNLAAEKTFGYTRGEVLGRLLAEVIVPPAMRERHRAGLARYLATGEGPVLDKRIELTALRRDGCEIPVELAIMRVGSKTPPSFIGFIRDLSERKRAEAALIRSEARFRRIVESGIIGIITADIYGNILDANSAFLDMVGYTRDEVLSGQVRWAEMTPPEWVHLDERAIDQLKASGVAAPWEKEYIRKDGTRVPILVGVAMIEPASGECVAFILDRTELRRTEEQLRQSQKMEAIGRFAAGVAHDFNNLLSIVLSYSALIGEGATDDALRADAGAIAHAGERAAELTRQLLAFGRQQILKPQIVDLNDIILQIDRFIRRIVGEDVELRTLPGAGLKKVRVDPGQIEQIIMNLVANARDAMPNGGQLTIETANVDLDEAYARQHVGVTAGPHVLLAVTDTGMGMDRATQARIFEPFFTTKARGKGTGLGLATVFGIVKQSGGSIWLYSEAGRGTAFKIYFPQTKETRTTESPPSPLPSALGTETILLVEDEAQVRAIARRILERQGYRVLEAESAPDGIRQCETFDGTIHLLLTDVVMPKMSGRELVERVAGRRPQMRVLYMSGYTDNTIVHHGVLDEGVAFLQKPITPEALGRKVREVLEAPVAAGTSGLGPKK